MTSKGVPVEITLNPFREKDRSPWSGLVRPLIGNSDSRGDDCFRGILGLFKVVGYDYPRPTALRGKLYQARNGEPRQLVGEFQTTDELIRLIGELRPGWRARVRALPQLKGDVTVFIHREPGEGRVTLSWNESLCAMIEGTLRFAYGKAMHGRDPTRIQDMCRFLEAIGEDPPELLGTVAPFQCN